MEASPSLQPSAVIIITYWFVCWNLIVLQIGRNSDGCLVPATETKFHSPLHTVFQTFPHCFFFLCLCVSKVVSFFTYSVYGIAVFQTLYLCIIPDVLLFIQSESKILSTKMRGGGQAVLKCITPSA